MTENREIEWLMEQLEACKDIITTIKCIHCQMADAQTPVALISDVEGGARVQVVGLCSTCMSEEQYDQD